MNSRLPKDADGKPIIKPRPGKKRALHAVPSGEGGQAPAAPKAQEKRLNSDGADGVQAKPSVSASENTQPTPDAKSNEAGERPRLNVGQDPVVLDYMTKYFGTGPTAGAFLRGGVPVRILAMDEDGYNPSSEDQLADGPAPVHLLKPETLQAYLQLRYLTYKMINRSFVRTAPTLTACKSIVSAATQGACLSLPVLRGVTHVPIVRSDGSVLDSPGYDEATRLLYLPNGLDVASVPTRPTRKQLGAALDLLLYVVGDFPFVSESDRANYLGLLLAPLLRLLAPGPWPLGAINAHMAGSGKTLLSKIPERLYGTVVRSEPADNDEEIRKSITSILLSTTAPVVVFDNVRRVLDSPVLEKLLTDEAWSDRILGVSKETATLSNDRLWLATGNNIAVGGDMSRRTLWVNVDPRDPRPWLRTGFAEADLLGYVTAHRGPIIGALLTLVRAWVAAGSPSGGLARTDDYRRWTASVGGILAHAGVPGEFWSPETDRAPVAVGDDEWAAFLAVMHDEFGDVPTTAREVLEHASAGTGMPSKMAVISNAARLKEALPGNLAEKLDRNGPAGTSKSLGRWFANMDGRYAGEFVARLAGDDGHKTKQWQVTKEVH